MKNEECQKNLLYLKKRLSIETNEPYYNKFCINYKVTADPRSKLRSSGNINPQKGNRKDKKSPSVLGDAETYFRKILRNYQDFGICRTTEKNSSDRASESKYTKNNVQKRSIYIVKKLNEPMPNKNLRPDFEKIISHLGSLRFSDNGEEASETTGGEDDDMKEVDDIIVKANKELQHVAEENQELLKLLEKPIIGTHFSTKDEEVAEEVNVNVIKQLEEAEREAKNTATNIYELKTRVGELLKKGELTEEETRELDHKNKQLKDQMVFFEASTKKIHELIEKTSKFSDLNQSTTINEENNFKNSCDDEFSKQRCCSCCSERMRQSDAPTFAKKLCQSYSMQEKLAAENSDLEGVRYKLQEELLNKDQSLETLQRELGNLQSEMRLVSRENKMLNEKLRNIQKKESKNHQSVKTKDSSSSGTSGLNSIKLQEYSENTYQLEKQLSEMENDVKSLHDEISAVQKEREYLEEHRKMICCLTRPCITPCPSNYLNSPRQTTMMTPFTASNTNFNNNKVGYSGQILRELSGQYDKLESNLKLKLNQVSSLKKGFDKLDDLTKDAEEFKKTIDDKIKECERKLNEMKSENKLSTEQEKQFMEVKRRLRAAQDSLQEELVFMKDQKMFLENIHDKYLDAQQQLDEQKQIVHTKMANEATTLNLGAQIVTTLQNKLEEITF